MRPGTSDHVPMVERDEWCRTKAKFTKFTLAMPSAFSPCFSLFRLPLAKDPGGRTEREGYKGYTCHACFHPLPFRCFRPRCSANSGLPNRAEVDEVDASHGHDPAPTSGGRNGSIAAPDQSPSLRAGQSAVSSAPPIVFGSMLVGSSGLSCLASSAPS